MASQLALTLETRNAHRPRGSRRARMHAAVLDALETLGDATNRELARYLQTEVCSITGRVFELRADGKVRLSGVRTCKVTGNRVASWSVSGN